MRKKIIAALAVGAIALSVAGCSSNAHPADSKKVTLSMAAYIGGKQEPAALPQLIKKFEKENPNITVDFKYVPGDYDTYNNSRLAAGTAADVLLTDKVRMTRWAGQGYLADLSDQPWVKRVDPLLKTYEGFGGKTYQFVAQNIGLGMYANLDLLKSAGINEVPQDWPSFISDLQQLKAKGKNGLLLPDETGWNGEMNALSLAASLVPKTWAPNYDTGNSTWYKAWVPVVEHERELIDKGLVDPKTMLGINPFTEGVNQFTAGSWAFYVDGAWDLSHYATQSSFKFTLNPYPGGAAGTKPRSVTYLGAGWGVNAASPHKAAAKAWINFFTQPANYEMFLKAEACFSTLKDVTGPVALQERPFADAFKNGQTEPSQVHTLNDPDSETEMQKAFVTLFTDPTTSAKSILTTMDKNVPKTPVLGK